MLWNVWQWQQRPLIIFFFSVFHSLFSIINLVSFKTFDTKTSVVFENTAAQYSSAWRDANAVTMTRRECDSPTENERKCVANKISLFNYKEN